MRLDRYFAIQFLRTFLGVLFVFLMILGFLGLVEQLRRNSSFDASFSEIATLAALEIPQAVAQIMPLIMIISSVALFLGLARTSEMVVTRAAGRSAVRALLAPVIVAFLIGVFGIAVLNPIVAATSKQFEVRNGALRGEASVVSIGKTGLWLRQGNQEAQTVIRAESTNLNGTVLSGATFLTFGAKSGPTERIEAQKATLEDGAWRLEDTKRWPLDPAMIAEAQAIESDTYLIPSTLTADQIRDSFGTPSSIPIWDLPAFIDRLQDAGFSATRHQVWLQIELANPLFLVAMVMIGAAFTVRHQRGGRTGMMVLFAILLAFTIYFLRNFAQILGENGELPAMLAAWAPPLAAIALALGMLLHNEDG